MEPTTKPKGLEDEDFDWRINPRKNNIPTIEWTSKLGGWVRARKDNNTLFLYLPCSSQWADSNGWNIIFQQQKQEKMEWEVLLCKVAEILQK